MRTSSSSSRPKFSMYRRLLAEILAEEAIGGRGWSLERALAVAKLILIDNPKRIFAESRRVPWPQFDAGAI